MDLNKAVEHCWDRRDYPEIISDDAGLDISIPRFITRGPWKGWGGEIYFKRFGEIMIDCVNKRKARQLIKKQIREELRNEL